MSVSCRSCRVRGTAWGPAGPWCLASSEPSATTKGEGTNTWRGDRDRDGIAVVNDALVSVLMKGRERQHNQLVDLEPLIRNGDKIICLVRLVFQTII